MNHVERNEIYSLKNILYTIKVFPQSHTCPTNTIAKELEYHQNLKIHANSVYSILTTRLLSMIFVNSFK